MSLDKEIFECNMPTIAAFQVGRDTCAMQQIVKGQFSCPFTDKWISEAYNDGFISMQINIMENQ